MESSMNERLKAVRTALKLSQRKFSKGIFLEMSSIALIEQGKIINELNGLLQDYLISQAKELLKVQQKQND